MDNRTEDQKRLERMERKIERLERMVVSLLSPYNRENVYLPEIQADDRFYANQAIQQARQQK